MNKLLRNIEKAWIREGVKHVRKGETIAWQKTLRTADCALCGTSAKEGKVDESFPGWGLLIHESDVKGNAPEICPECMKKINEDASPIPRFAKCNSCEAIQREKIHGVGFPGWKTPFASSGRQNKEKLTNLICPNCALELGEKLGLKFIRGTWTALTYASDSLLTSTKMTQNQANFAALAGQDGGSPVLDHAVLTGLGDDDHSAIYLNTTRHDTTTRHPVSVIKTGTGSASGTLAGTTGVNITMHRKSFWPQLSSEEEFEVFTKLEAGNPNNYIGYFHMYNPVGTSEDYWIQWDYLSASGPAVIWVIADDKGKIQHCWEAGDIPDKNVPSIVPIKIKEMPLGWANFRIVLPAEIDDMKNKAKNEKDSLSRYIIKNHKVDLITKKLKSKGDQG